MANRILRDKMRGPRKKAKEQALQDQVLLKKASLDIKLLPETEQDKKLASLLKLNSSMSSEQKESELREEIIEESIFSATTSSPGTSNAVQSKSKSVNHLQKIVKRKREDDVSSVPAKTSNSIGVVVKKTSTPVKTSPIKLSLCSTDYGNSSSSSDENE